MTEKQFLSAVQFLHNELYITYRNIGDSIGVTGQYISMIVRGKKRMTLELLKKAENSAMVQMAIGAQTENE